MTKLPPWKFGKIDESLRPVQKKVFFIKLYILTPGQIKTSLLRDFFCSRNPHADIVYFLSKKKRKTSESKNYVFAFNLRLHF